MVLFSKNKGTAINSAGFYQFQTKNMEVFLLNEIKHSRTGLINGRVASVFLRESGGRCGYQSFDLNMTRGLFPVLQHGNVQQRSNPSN